MAFDEVALVMEINDETLLEEAVLSVEEVSEIDLVDALLLELEGLGGLEGVLIEDDELPEGGGVFEVN